MYYVSFTFLKCQHNVGILLLDRILNLYSIGDNQLVRSSIETNNLISSKDVILIYNILRDLGFIMSLKGTKLLNKAIQVVIKSDNEFISVEEVYHILALNYTCFNTAQIRNAIKYAIDTRSEEKTAKNFESIFGYKYDKECLTNKSIIEEIARVMRNCR